MLTLLDGLPTESWYKLSSSAWVEEIQEEQRQVEITDVRSVIFAQLHGQKIVGS